MVARRWYVPREDGTFRWYIENLSMAATDFLYFTLEWGEERKEKRANWSQNVLTHLRFLDYHSCKSLGN